jgi:hypothetical protein
MEPTLIRLGYVLHPPGTWYGVGEGACGRNNDNTQMVAAGERAVTAFDQYRRKLTEIPLLHSLAHFV